MCLGGRTDRQKISVYCDSDFAEDVETRHSTTGNLIYLGNSLVSWASKKQKLIATSSTEAEFLAVFYTLRDTQYLGQLISSIIPGKNVEITLYQDNMSTIALLQNQSTKGRSKHFDVKLRAVNDAINSGFFRVEYRPTSEMWADIMTKATSRAILLALRPNVIVPINISTN